MRPAGRWAGVHGAGGRRAGLWAALGVGWLALTPGFACREAVEPARAPVATAVPPAVTTAVAGPDATPGPIGEPAPDATAGPPVDVSAAPTEAADATVAPPTEAADATVATPTTATRTPTVEVRAARQAVVPADHPPLVDGPTLRARRSSEAPAPVCGRPAAAGASAWTRPLEDSRTAPLVSVAVDRGGAATASVASEHGIHLAALAADAAEPTLRVAPTSSEGDVAVAFTLGGVAAQLSVLGERARLEAGDRTWHGSVAKPTEAAEPDEPAEPAEPSDAAGAATPDDEPTPEPVNAQTVARLLAVAAGSHASGAGGGWLGVGWLSTVTCPLEYDIDVAKRRCRLEGPRNSGAITEDADVENRLVAWVPDAGLEARPGTAAMTTVPLIALNRDRATDAAPGTNPPETLSLVAAGEGYVALWRSMGALYALPLGADGAWIAPPEATDLEAPTPRSLAHGELSAPSAVALGDTLVVVYAKRMKKGPYELQLATFDALTQQATRPVPLIAPVVAAPGDAPAPPAAPATPPPSRESPTLALVDGHLLISWFEVTKTATTVVSGTGRSLDEAVAAARPVAAFDGRGLRLAQAWDGARGALAWLVGKDMKTVQAFGMTTLACAAPTP